MGLLTRATPRPKGEPRLETAKIKIAILDASPAGVKKDGDIDMTVALSPADPVSREVPTLHETIVADRREARRRRREAKSLKAAGKPVKTKTKTKSKSKSKSKSKRTPATKREQAAMQSVQQDAAAGKFKKAQDYHGESGHGFEDARVAAILAAPDTIHRGSGGKLLYVQGGDIVVVRTSGSGLGVLTAYGSSGKKGKSGVAHIGGRAEDRGPRVTSRAVKRGKVPGQRGRAPILWRSGDPPP